MSRWPGPCRQTVEECQSLDINWLSRNGFLRGLASVPLKWINAAGEETGSISVLVRVGEHGDNQGDHMRLIYTATDGDTGEKTRFDYRIQLVSTPCNYGGVRYWFICPLVKNNLPCRKRIGKIYLPPGAKYFGCRRCYNLTYRCQKEHDKRVDALLRNPDILAEKMSSKKSKDSLLALRAYFKVLDKLW